MIRDDCAGCEGCAALEAEAGPEYGRLYARKLLIRGWSGNKSAAEKLYLASHPPEWYAVATSHRGNLQPFTSGVKPVGRTSEMAVAV